MLQHWYSIHFEGKTESLASLHEHLGKRSVGACLMHFLDVDFENYLISCENITQSRDVLSERSRQLLELYRQLEEELASRHPLFAVFVEGQLIGDCMSYALDSQPMNPSHAIWKYKSYLERRTSEDLPTLDEISLLEMVSIFRKRFQNFVQLQGKLSALVDAVLDAPPATAQLGILQRYLLLRQTNSLYLELVWTYYAALDTQWRVFVDGKSWNDPASRPDLTSEHIEKTAKKEVTSALYQTSDALGSILLSAFDYMASQELPLRRCGHCGRYFLPIHRLSRYCDRPLPERPEKTCRDVAAALQYQANVQKDEAKALYRKVNNRKQMYAKRNAELKPQIKTAYLQWHSQAREKLEQVEAGTLSFEDFAAWMED